MNRASFPWVVLALLLVPAGATLYALAWSPGEDHPSGEAPGPASVAPAGPASEEPATPRPNLPAGRSPLAACCGALWQNQKVSPPPQARVYAQLATLCDTYRERPQPAGEALASFRAAAGALSLPAVCLDLTVAP